VGSGGWRVMRVMGGGVVRYGEGYMFLGRVNKEL